MTSGIGTLLHAHFQLRNQQAFQRLLATGAGDTSHIGGVSLDNSPRSFRSKAGRDEEKIDINARDGFGRTVLHLASTSVDASSVEYVRLILKHPELNVNLQDRESQWTALHRAMYIGNLGVALLLLQHSNIDPTIKDLEGYTAFDLYNSTVEGTKPQSSLFPTIRNQTINGAELFTWGANRNASLGHGDSSDRTFPDQVPVPRIVTKGSDELPVEDRFARIGVRQVQMGRLHTAVITNPPSAFGTSGSELSLCGFGSGGRLGVTQHTQYALRSLSWASSSQGQHGTPKAGAHLRVKVISVALGQDHTLALTENGEVYSWGLNRFSQLGYNIDDGSSAAQSTTRSDSTVSSNGEQIQLIPRRVYGPLKKEIVLGIAASKGASACWVRDGIDGVGGGSNVYTWGLNGGQLGYDRTTTGQGAQIQLLPRKVTKITRPVVQIALGESAMACLLSGTGSVGGGWKGDVLVFWGDLVGRVSFPAHTFPLPISPYRPPQALKSTSIVKIVTNSNQNHINFACVSEGGEVFTFGVPGVPPVGVLSSASNDVDMDGSAGPGMALAKFIKPQRVLALRKGLVGTVRDVAIGQDGSLIVCTDSGHVYVRSRSSDTILGGGYKPSSVGSGKSQKFIRVPYLQRIVRVCASSTGAFGALRVDAEIKPIHWPGWDLIHDMKSIRPWLWKEKTDSLSDREQPEDSGDSIPLFSQTPTVRQEQPDDDVDEYDDDGDIDIRQDINTLRELCSFITKQEKDQVGSWVGEMAYGADLMIPSTAPRLSFPLHTVMLGMRSNVMKAALLSSSESVFDCKAAAGPPLTFTVSSLQDHAHDEATSGPRNLTFDNFHPLSVLILMHYIYTDELVCIWDRRVCTAVPSTSFSNDPKVTPVLTAQIKSELRALANILVLPEMQKAIESVAKRPVNETMRASLTAFWNSHNTGVSPPTVHASSSLAPDVVLLLAEGHEVFAHSSILRSRCAYFEDFLGNEEWTRKRKGPNGKVVEINLQHMKLGVVEYVMKWLCCGQTKGLFGSLEFAQSVDAVLEFQFEVIAVANELLLFPLVMLSSQLILKFLNIHNTCYILSEASYYHAYELVSSVEGYISENLETFLETHMLDVLSPSLIKHLSAYIRTRQEEKSSVVRSNKLVNHAMSKWQEWLEGEDIPSLILPGAGFTSFGQRDSGKIKPLSPVLRPLTTTSPASKPRTQVPGGDDIFDMDDMDISLPSIDLPESRSPAAQPPAVDMRSIMAEAASGSEPHPKSAHNQTAAQSKASPNDGYLSTLRHTRSNMDISSSPSPSPQRIGTSRNILNIPGSGAATPNAFPILGGSPTPASKSRDPNAPSNIRPPPQASNPVVPGLGPVYSPARQPTPKAPVKVPRRISNPVKSTPKAWVSTPVIPEPSSTLTNANGKGMSFVAIQQAQLEQGTSNAKDKRSLLEIQQEEQAKREEEDFLKWWNAEEERVRLETEAMERLASAGDKGRQGGKTRAQKNTSKKSKKGKEPNDGVNASEGSSNSKTTLPPGHPRPSDVHPSPNGNRRRPRGKKGDPPPQASAP
ncbi:hypothetical protein EV360DRAFT_40745 [Lentinula raphanica]|nr:hypothetical protein EV360DRAFT_40745 [Lentinula raphanica]